MLESRIDRELAKRTELVKLEEQIRECIDNSEDLNDWEDEFLENILIQVASRERTLSEAQTDTLEKIAYKVEWGMDAYWEEYSNE